jgi:hypothetical protein
MRNLSKQLGYEESDQEPHVGAVGAHNSAEASDQIGTAPVAKSQDKDSQRRGVSNEDIRNRKVDPEAVRESFKEAELDPTAETDPEEGETAA